MLRKIVFFFLLSVPIYSIELDFLDQLQKPYYLLLRDCLKDEVLEIDNYSLKNRNTSLGSLIKIFTILAKYNNKPINISESYQCKGFKATDYSVCWLKNGHGYISLLPAFAVSCNSYFYFFSREIDFDLFINVLRDWGLYYGFENKGRQILNREEQIASMIGKNNFIKIKPIDFFNAMEMLLLKKKRIPEDLYNLIYTGMRMVYVNGTVKEVREKLDLSSEVNIICKTGTGQYEKDGKVDIKKVNGFFIGLLDNRYLCFVMIEETRGIEAAKIGLMVFKEILSVY